MCYDCYENYTDIGFDTVGIRIYTDFREKSYREIAILSNFND